MSAIDDLGAARDDARAAMWVLYGQRSDELDAVQREVESRWQPRIAEARKALSAAEQAWREAVSAAASHPWEGKKVTRQNGTGRGRSPETEYGIIEVRRVETQFPDNLAHYRWPSIGSPFVRILKKDGTPGARIATHWREWKLVEECE